MLTLLDIGARGGLLPHWQRVRSQLYAVGIEPDPSECTRLITHKAFDRVLNIAVSDRPGKMPFYQAACTADGSLLPANIAMAAQYVETIEPADVIEVTVETLDKVCNDEGLCPDALKIDTQGSAAQVLRGGGILKQVGAVEIEVGVIPRYAGEVLWDTVHDLLTEAGLTLVDLRPHYYMPRHAGLKRGHIAFMDALYLRVGHPQASTIAQVYDAPPSSCPPFKGRLRLARWLTSACRWLDREGLTRPLRLGQP